jgi:glycosyltransferase involved in cell wall biosynthesis
MKLSALIVTYNQERYIEQAVRSVLAQQTDFDFEVVIADDCSRDGTREILRRLQDERPDRIRLLLNERNLGIHGNYRNAWFLCKGQYIGLLEGDDYWTASDKLQRQVDFLDAHPECVLCFHDVVVFEDDGAGPEGRYCPPDLPEICGIEDLLQEMFINTTSVVCRNRVFTEFPTWGLDLAIGDWPFFLWISSLGKLGYLPQVMAAYRKHGDGLWSRTGPEERIRSITAMYERVNEHFGYQYDAIIRVLIGRWKAYFRCDAERQRWMATARSAQAQLDEAQRKARQLRHELRELRERAGRPPVAG